MPSGVLRLGVVCAGGVRPAGRQKGKGKRRHFTVGPETEEDPDKARARAHWQSKHGRRDDEDDEDEDDDDSATATKKPSKPVVLDQYGIPIESSSDEYETEEDEVGVVAEDPTIEPAAADSAAADEHCDGTLLWKVHLLIRIQNIIKLRMIMHVYIVLLDIFFVFLSQNFLCWEFRG